MENQEQKAVASADVDFNTVRAYVGQKRRTTSNSLIAGSTFLFWETASSEIGGLTETLVHPRLIWQVQSLS
jgi:hypothetical protein